MEYFFSWCINQIVSCICLMMVFFQHIYLSICCKPWFYVLSHMNSLHKHEDCMKYLLTRWEDVFFCNEHFLRCEKWMFFCNAGFILRYHLLIATWCALESKVSTSEFNLMCVGVELDLKNFKQSFLFLSVLHAHRLTHRQIGCNSYTAIQWYIQ